MHWPLRSFMRTGTFFIGNKKFNTIDEGFMKGYNMPIWPLHSLELFYKISKKADIGYLTPSKLQKTIPNKI